MHKSAPLNQSPSPSLHLPLFPTLLLNVLLCRSLKKYCFINASRWPRSTVPFHKQFAASYLSFLHTFLSQYACDRCRYRNTCRCRYRYGYSYRVGLQSDTIWPHEMANDNAPYIKLYKRVLKKLHFRPSRERRTEPSMTSGKYTKVSRYMCSCICASVCVCVCQAMPCK